MNTKLTFKKALSALLVLMMVLSSLTILPMTASATTLAATDSVRESMAPVWNGSAVTAAEAYKGSGTESDPLLIYSGADLKGLVGAVSASEASPVHIKFMNDINMNNKDFTALVIPKPIVLDGNNKVIYNLTSTAKETSNGKAGLFNVAPDGSVIRDFTFVKVTSTNASGSGQTAVLFSYYNGLNLTIDNVDVIDATVTGAGTQAAVYVGYSSSSTVSGEWNIRNCDVSDTEISGGLTAGMLGQITYAGLLTIENCTVGRTPATETEEADTTITGTGETAGFIAKNYCKNMQIINCTNNATINGTGNNTGGLVAQGLPGSGTNTFKNCTNAGKVTATKGNVGGIMGHYYQSGASLNMIGCLNTGSVTSAATAGGLIAKVTQPKNNVNFSFVACANEGTVTSNNSNYVGGLVAMANRFNDTAGSYADYRSSWSFANCYNTGTLNLTTSTRYNYIGGIMGDLRSVTNNNKVTHVYAYNCYDYSERNFTDNYKQTNLSVTNGGVFGNIDNGQCTFDMSNMSALQNGGNLTAYTYTTNRTATNKNLAKDYDTTDITTPMGSMTLKEAIDALKSYRAEINTWEGAGTADMPYVLTAKEQLIALSTYASFISDEMYLNLGASIDLKGIDFKPIAAAGKTIYLDGNHYAIQNLTVSGQTHSGLFKGVGNNSTFKNLKLTNVDITATSQSAAALVCDTGATGLTFYNIYVSGKITAPNNAGALIGASTTGNNLSTYKATYCVNAADITANYVGGLFGYVKGAINYDVSYCANLGTLTSTDDFYPSVGGILGISPRGSELVDGVNHCPFTNSTFSYCYNVGTLKATNAAASYLGMAGIVANHRVANVKDGSNTSTITIDHCYDISTREVAKTSLASQGVFAGGDDDQYKSRTVSNCMAYGNYSAVTVKHANLTETNNVLVENKFVTDTEEKTQEYLALEAAIADIQAAINALNVPTLTLEGNISLRMKLTEPFGLMTISNITYKGNVLAVADYDEYFTEYGFIYFAVDAGAAAPDADAIKVGGYRVAGELYEETSATAGKRFEAAYDKLSASALNTDLYIVSYVVIGGETYVSDAVKYNPYELAQAAANGQIDSITDTDEIKVYKKMVDYYKAYKAYLDNLK